MVGPPSRASLSENKDPTQQYDMGDAHHVWIRDISPLRVIPLTVGVETYFLSLSHEEPNDSPEET